MKKGHITKISIGLTAYWGNDDAKSTIKVTRSRWKSIQEGAQYTTSAWSW